MGNTRVQFLPDCYYHLYNHGNADDNIFRNEDNYHYFLQKYAYYINPIADTYAFCLMPNHFHFLIRMKTLLEINPQGFQNLADLASNTFDKKMSQQMSNFLNSYSKSYNKKFDRIGSLFRDNIKRKHVESDAYFSRLIHYIHANPVVHGFVKEMSDWKFSSYNGILSDRNSHLKKEEVIQRFGSKHEYLKFHNQKIDRRIALEFDF